MRVALTSPEIVLSDIARAVVYSFRLKRNASVLSWKEANCLSLPMSQFKQILGGLNPTLLKISLRIRLTLRLKECSSQVKPISVL